MNLFVRVNDELLLDAGIVEERGGSEVVIRPPLVTLFHQGLAYLRAKPDPPSQLVRRHSGRGFAGRRRVLSGG